jgi:large subunit ribosomal protein L29
MKAIRIRELTLEEKKKNLDDLRNELIKERGRAAMGGSPPSPGRIKDIRRNIARLITIMKEEEELE